MGLGISQFELLVEVMADGLKKCCLPWLGDLFHPNYNSNNWGKLCASKSVLVEVIKKLFFKKANPTACKVCMDVWGLVGGCVHP